jgi:Icc-related predicted phosphoesterase
VRLVCISDTHNRHAEMRLPAGEVLVHAGDATMRGSRREVQDFVDWLAAQPHAHKVLVAGNHDWLFQREPDAARAMVEGRVTYLQDAGTTIDGISFWGSPWQPWMMSWAFNLRRGAALREKWALVPAGTDVLVTHTPPHGIGDRVVKPVGRAFCALTGHERHVGCEELRAALPHIRPLVHVFGHIHEGYGVVEQDGTRFVNASTCDMNYRELQPPIVVDVEPRGAVDSARSGG